MKIGAFRHFGGVPATVLMDNSRALVSRPWRGSSAAEFHPRLAAFSAHWNFEPRACLPGRARTRGKDERSVGYVKNNAIGGREFASRRALEGHLSAWLREVADRRTHGTTGESPIARFATERTALASLADRRSFGSPVELARTVSADCAVVLDTNQYPVPWRLVGERVLVGVAGGRAGGIRHPSPARGVRGRGRRGVLTVAVVSDEVLAEWLTSLRLPTIRDRLGSLLDEAARRELSLREVVVLLCERELSAKRDSRIRRNLGLARFPSVRELADFDHDAQPGVDAGQARARRGPDARLSVVEAPMP